MNVSPSCPKGNAGKLRVYCWRQALNGRRHLSSDGKTSPTTCRFAFERKYSISPWVCVLLPHLSRMLWICFLSLKIWCLWDPNISLTQFQRSWSFSQDQVWVCYVKKQINKKILMSLYLLKTECRRNYFIGVNITSCVSSGGYYQCFVSELEYTLERLAIIFKCMYKKILHFWSFAPLYVHASLFPTYTLPLASWCVWDSQYVLFEQGAFLCLWKTEL